MYKRYNKVLAISYASTLKQFAFQEYLILIIKAEN